MVPLLRPVVYRCTPWEDPTLVLPVAPRGRVFPQEAHQVVVRFGLWAPDSARFTFRMGASHVLDRMVSPHTVRAEVIALDARERAALDGLRGRIRWGVEDRPTATFSIDPPGERERAEGERVQGILAASPPLARRLVIARLLLEWGFDQAALREAQRVLVERSAEPHATALALLALARLGLGEPGEVQELHGRHWIPAHASLEAHRDTKGIDCDLLDAEAAEAIRREVSPLAGCGVPVRAPRVLPRHGR